MTRTESHPSLFPITVVDEHFEGIARSYGFKIVELDIGDITFQAGQNESVHRWYRLTPSFSPALVRYFLQSFRASSSSLVLDPFAGRGTTTIECQKNDVPSIGYEINPLLQLVGNDSLKWTPRSSSLFDRYIEQVSREVRRFRDDSPEEAASALGIALPNIHDLYRWWKRDVLRDLLVARTCAMADSFVSIRHFLRLALTGASLDCANIHRNHPTITFDDNNGRDIDVVDDLRERLRQMMDDLHALTSAQVSRSESCRIEVRDSCSNLAIRGMGRRKATHVITSPPYPNRFSYVHQTRPQLHFMEVVEERAAATEIDLQTIGGTWGRATSNLQKQLISPPADLRPFLGYWEELSQKSTLMCNYATKYFIDLDKHIKQLRTVAASGFYGAYVVGNSRLSKVEIYTETVLANLFRLNGFEVDQIVVFRKRGGRKRLYESAVCVTV